MVGDGDMGERYGPEAVELDDWAHGTVAGARRVRTRIWMSVALALNTASSTGGFILLGMSGVSTEGREGRACNRPESSFDRGLDSLHGL